MLFNTFQFFVFFVVVLAVFFALPHRWRNAFLLIASYYFYMCWSVKYMAVIWGITLVDYAAGIIIEQSETRARRKLFLALSICCNFGLLFIFKYYDFFGASLRAILQTFTPSFDIPVLHLLLPVGISFHTFQAVSYTVEVYRGKAKAERNLLHYALYVAFFPQMVAGPIESPNHLLPQFRTRKRLDGERLRSGLECILWGLFKKAVVADLVAVLVNTVYARPREFSGPMLLLATFFFTFQIYCDFSGYSDMAVGIARIMGFDLTINFRQPYTARSIAEFWHRWHISLSTWFRDYVFIPMGGSRVPKPQWFFNILVVFLVSGLWHGANWTFVIWGGLHGLYLIWRIVTAGVRREIRSVTGVERMPRLHAAWQTACVFALAMFGWIFFRANSVSDALYVAAHFWRRGSFHLGDLFTAGLPRFELALALTMIALVYTADFLLARPSPEVRRYWEMPAVRWAGYYACFWGIVFFGVFERLDFIYFQF